MAGVIGEAGMVSASGSGVVAESLARAESLAEALAAAGGGQGRAGEPARGLAATVIRPLRAVVSGDGGAARVGTTAGSGDGGAEPEAVLDRLAADLVAAVAAGDARAAVLEAAAGAGRLVASSGDGGRVAALRAAAGAVPAGDRGRVTVAENGPYLVTGPAAGRVTSWLGEELATPGVAALCRCGRSGSKPWCDGTHAEIGFSGAKRADRVPDRLDEYPARQFTVTDNRGLCAHSGRCTDALPAAFRVGAEPFVAAAGGRADDVLRAVQACPSGALGAEIAARRAAELVDGDRPPGIEVSRDGPYRLTGGVAVYTPDGEPVARPAGASPEHCSLCRCGQSANKPFCSGAHWYADFHDPVAAPEDEPTLFAWAGGYPALLRMTQLFYERHVPADDLLAPLFARMEPDHPERVACWLSEVFGGPELYSRRYGGYARMISQHLGKHLTETQRSRWVALLARSADEAGLPTDPEFRAAFVSYLEWGSRIAVENSTDGAAPPEGMPVPRWWWVCNATPAARPSSLPTAAPQPEPEAETPADGEPVSFARHVRGLFRARDRASMRFVFDLWSADDVAAHAEAILGRLHDGSMPCDGPWPPERIAILRRWADTGKNP